MKKLISLAVLVSCLLVGTIAAAGQGRIVVNNDDWTFSARGFVAPNDAAKFAKNVAAWFTGGSPGSFLAYSNHLGLTGAQLATAMTSAGHTWLVNSTMPFTLANISAYDAVFLGVTPVDNQVLIDYVNAGGNVYVYSGGDTEPNKWNTFLEYFGLNFRKVNNGIIGNIPINSTHPLFAGVDHLYQNIGTSIVDLDPTDPTNKILVTYSGQALYAIYDPSRNPDVHGCMWLKGKPVRSRKVILSQLNESNQSITTDVYGCYEFENVVSGKSFDVLIKGPIVP